MDFLFLFYTICTFLTIKRLIVFELFSETTTYKECLIDWTKIILFFVLLMYFPYGRIVDGPNGARIVYSIPIL